ncbi:MAG: hypothetical protein GWO03_15630, partial [Gammaproteobacteria bacterium]|nr:hypothetical protein [Gammaproteobacteria bacterium]
TAAAKDGRAAVDVEALYPTIGRILRGAGSTVRLGGIVEAPQRFDSSETTTYTWDYGPQQPELRRLYERAKGAQWSAADLPWDTAVDLEAELFELDPAWAAADWFRRMDRRERRRLTVAYNANLISNF